VARVCSVADSVAGRRFSRSHSFAGLRRRRATLRLFEPSLSSRTLPGW
jgi:hypothetical protein